MIVPWTQFTSSLVVLGLVFIGVVGLDISYRGLHRHPIHPNWPVGNANADLGRSLIQSYGCGACHEIPGLRGGNGRVGPKLDGFVDQMYIAGMLTNTPENLAIWLQNPRHVNPGTAMPDLGVSAEEARHMVAFLYLTR